jgi:hypothetical protein
MKLKVTWCRGDNITIINVLSKRSNYTMPPPACSSFKRRNIAQYLPLLSLVWTPPKKRKKERNSFKTGEYLDKLPYTLSNFVKFENYLIILIF